MSQALRFVCGDFEAAWNAMAADPNAGHRGNLMFASLVGVMLRCVGDVDELPVVLRGLTAIDARYGDYPELLAYLGLARRVYQEEPLRSADDTEIEVAITGAQPLYIRTDRLYLDLKEVLTREGHL